MINNKDLFKILLELYERKEGIKVKCKVIKKEG